MVMFITEFHEGHFPSLFAHRTFCPASSRYMGPREHDLRISVLHKPFCNMKFFVSLAKLGIKMICSDLVGTLNVLLRFQASVYRIDLSHDKVRPDTTHGRGSPWTKKGKESAQKHLCVFMNFNSTNFWAFICVSSKRTYETWASDMDNFRMHQ